MVGKEGFLLILEKTLGFDILRTVGRKEGRKIKGM